MLQKAKELRYLRMLSSLYYLQMSKINEEFSIKLLIPYFGFFTRNRTKTADSDSFIIYERRIPDLKLQIWIVIPDFYKTKDDNIYK